MAVRVPWDDDFPDVIIHAPIAVVKSHEDYDAAKSGDARAGVRLARCLISPDDIVRLRTLMGASVSVLVPERNGVNASVRRH